MRVILMAERLGGRMICLATVMNDFQADVQLYKEFPKGIYTNQRWIYDDDRIF